MISPMEVYLIGILDNVISASCLLTFMSLPILGATLLTTVHHNGPYSSLPRCVKIVTTVCIIVFVLSGFAAVFLPSTKHAIAIYTIPKVLNNEDVQAIPIETLQVIRGYLQASLGEFDKATEAVLNTVTNSTSGK